MVKGATSLMESSPVLYLDIEANVSGRTMLSVQLWREEFESVSPTSEDCKQNKQHRTKARSINVARTQKWVISMVTKATDVL